MSGITVGQAGDVLVAVKQANDPDHRARLRHEADLLGRLDHPGVVRLVDFHEGPPAALRTAFVGPDSWRTSAATAADFAALTAIVADLHDSGLAHGDLRADHVLVDADQRPILCGFADAGPATPERMLADRAALASMLRDHAERVPGSGARLRDAANTLDEPALPTRAAIRLLDERAPVSAPATNRWAQPNRTQLLVAAAVVAIAGLVGIGAIWMGSSDEAPPTAPAAAPAEPAPTAQPAVASTPEANRPSPSADAAATVIVHDGRRYGVGVAGDIVEVADWACAGEATPAVLRPSSGDIVVFTEWPEPGGELLPSLHLTIDGAIEFVVSDTPCPDLRVRTADGSQLIEVPT